MSHTADLIALAVLDLAAIAALAAICLVPFRLGRRPLATVVQTPSDRIEPARVAEEWSAEPAA